MATIHTLCGLSQLLLLHFLKHQSSFEQDFREFLNTIIIFIQGDDDKLQHLSAHFLLVWLKSPMNKSEIHDPLHHKRETLLPYIEIIIQLVNWCLSHERSDKYKFEVKLKILDIYENLLLNYNDVLPKCESFYLFLDFFKEQSLMMSDDYVKKQSIAINILIMMPRVITDFFYLLVKHPNSHIEHNYIFTLLSHMTNMVHINYQDIITGKPDSFNIDLYGIIASIITRVIHNVCESGYVEGIKHLIDDDIVYETFYLYAYHYNFFKHRFFLFIAEVCKIPDILIIHNNKYVILDYCKENLKDVLQRNEVPINDNDLSIVNSSMFAIGNLLLYQNNSISDHHVQDILNHILKFFDLDKYEKVSRNLIYSYGKIALVFPDVVLNYFDKYLLTFLKIIVNLNFDDSEGKWLAIKGIIQLIKANNYPIQDVFDEITMCIISSDDIPQYIVSFYQGLVRYYNSIDPTNFLNMWETKDEEYRFLIETKLLRRNQNCY